MKSNMSALVFHFFFDKLRAITSVGRHNSLEKEEAAMVGLLNRERWLNISTPEHRWHLDKMNPSGDLR